MNQISAVILFAFVLTVVHSATITWSYDFSGATTASWDDASNWDTGTVPTAGDTVVIRSGTTNSIYIDEFIELPTDVTIEFLDYQAQMYGIRGPGTLTVTNMTADVSFFYEMDVVVTGHADFIGSVYFDQSTILIESGAMMVHRDQSNVNFGVDTQLTNNGEWHIKSNIDIFSSESYDARISANSKITNNGLWTFIGEFGSRIGNIEIEQTSNGELWVELSDEEAYLYIQHDDDNVPDNLEVYNGAPSTWDGEITIVSGLVEFYGGSVTWAATLDIDIQLSGSLMFTGTSDYLGLHTFSGPFDISDSEGLFIVSIFARVTPGGPISLNRLDFNGGIFNEAEITVVDLVCGYPQCCLYDFPTFNGGTVSLTGTESKPDGCNPMRLDNGAVFTLEEDAVMTAVTDIMEWGTSTLETPGTFVNKGSIVLKPQAATSGPHAWTDINVDHQGVIECQPGLEGHCLKFYMYDGAPTSSVATGQFIINSISTDYLDEFDRVWGPLEFSGNWEFKGNFSISGGAVVALIGTEGFECDDEIECGRRKTMTLNPAGKTYNFDIFNVRSRIRFYSEADMIIDKCLWDAGLWGGDGDVTIKEEMTINDSGLGSDTEKYLIGKRIIIEKKLIIGRAGITGLEGAEILIQEGAILEQVYDNIGADSVGDFGTDFTLTNEGTFDIVFGNFGATYSGVVEIVNKGIMGMKNDPSLYAASSAAPEFTISEGGSMIFTEEGQLTVRIFAETNTYDDDYLFSDHYDFYRAEFCQFGGKLIIEFVEPTGCVPVCPSFEIAAGDTWNIFTQRGGEEIEDDDEPHYPCYGEFDEIEIVGLDSDLQAQLIYNNGPTSGLSDFGQTQVIICAVSDMNCGTPNQFTIEMSPYTPSGTGTANAPEGTGTSAGNNTEVSFSSVVSTSIIVLFTMILL